MPQDLSDFVLLKMAYTFYGNLRMDINITLILLSHTLPTCTNTRFTITLFLFISILDWLERRSIFTGKISRCCFADLARSSGEDLRLHDWGLRALRCGLPDLNHNRWNFNFWAFNNLWKVLATFVSWPFVCCCRAFNHFWQVPAKPLSLLFVYCRDWFLELLYWKLCCKIIVECVICT